MKYVSIIAWTLGMFLALTGINALLNRVTTWDFTFLVGWFTVSTCFATINWYNYKRLSIDHSFKPGNWLIAMGIAILVLFVIKAFFASIQVKSDLAEGLIVGYFYNMVTNELDKRELKKIEKK